MRKKCSILLIVFCMLLIGAGSSFHVNAADENCQLEDKAGLLTEKETAKIQKEIEKLEDKTGWDIMAVTTDDAEGTDATYYAEAWFDDKTRSDDGIIFLIDMDNREIVLRTFGEAIQKITDSQVNKILDVGYEKISREEYGKTLEVMIQKTGKYAYRQITVTELLIALAAALAAGGITVAVIISSYRLKFGGYKYPIEKNGSVQLSREEDAFVNEFITHRHIPKSNGKSGGSTTTHTGAGGRTSGGGSRKF